MENQLQRSLDLSDKIQEITLLIIENIKQSYPESWEDVAKQVLLGDLSVCHDLIVHDLYAKLRELELQHSSYTMKMVNQSQDNIIELNKMKAEGRLR